MRYKDGHRLDCQEGLNKLKNSEQEICKNKGGKNIEHNCWNLAYRNAGLHHIRDDHQVWQERLSEIDLSDSGSAGKEFCYCLSKDRPKNKAFYQLVARCIFEIEPALKKVEVLDGVHGAEVFTSFRAPVYQDWILREIDSRIKHKWRSWVLVWTPADTTLSSTCQHYPISQQSQYVGLYPSYMKGEGQVVPNGIQEMSYT